MKTKKAKINSILEKKLEELDSLLQSITSYNDNNDPNLYREIELRFIFAKTLLTAEISSRPINVDGQDQERLTLGHMAKRLTDLEDAFISQLTGQDTGLVIEPEIPTLESDGYEEIEEEGKEPVWEEIEEEGREPVWEEIEEEGREPGWEEIEEEGKEPVWQVIEEEGKESVKEEIENLLTEEPVRGVNKKGVVGCRIFLVSFGLIGLVIGMISLVFKISEYMNGDNLFLIPT